MNSVKAGARHSSADQAAIQAAHDGLVTAGAVCGPTKAWTPPMSIKSIGGGAVEGYLVRYTDPSQLDLAGDYFDKNTRTGLRDGQELVTLWHHDQDPQKRGPIGKGVVTFTDAGIWFKSWLNRRDAYEMFILKLVEMGKAGYSSGADTATVVRQPIAGRVKANRLARWDIHEGSITPIPMDASNRVSLKSMLADMNPRERLLADLDDLERQLRIERELAALEGR